MDFLMKAICAFISNIIRGFLDTVMGGVVEAFQLTATSTLTNSIVISAHNAVLVVSLSLIVLFSVKQYFDTYVMESNGDPDADPLDILVRGSQATAIASCSTWFFYSFINFCSAFAGSVITGTGDESEFTTKLTSAVEVVTTLTGTNFFVLLFLLSILIGWIAFHIIATIRAAELALMYIVLPLFSTELCYASHERFNGLVTSIAVTGLYFILQLICFLLFNNMVIAEISGFTPESDGKLTPDSFLVIGFMIVMLKSPQWLDKFVYSTGVGGAAKAGAGRAIPAAGRAVVGLFKG